MKTVHDTPQFSRGYRVRFRRLIPACLALCCCVLSEKTGNSQPPPSVPISPGFRDHFAFASPPQLERQLVSLQQLRDAQRWQEAVALLLELADSDSAGVVEADPHRFLGIRTWCHAELASWPEAGRAAYRRAIDPVALPRYQDAIARRDSVALHTIINEYFGSSVHADALWQLALWAWDDGQLQAAENYWLQMLPRELIVADTHQHVRFAILPESEYRPEDVMARIALCRVFLREPDEAKRHVEAFDAMFPNATGTLAGSTQRYADALSRILDERENWKHTAPSNRGEARSIEVLGLSWSRDLEQNTMTDARLHVEIGHQSQSSVYSAIVNDESVIVIAPDRIQVLNVADGTPFWPSHVDTDDGVIYASRIDDEAQRPILPGAGVPRATGATSRAHLFAALGWPIIVPAQSELRRLTSRIVSSDVVTTEGRTSWIADDSDVLPENWRFAGRLVVAEEQLVVPTVTRAGPIALGMASLNVKDGTLNWHREICGVVDTRPLRTHVIGSNLPLLSDDQIIWSTIAAGVISVNAGDGAVNWAVSYPSYESAANLADLQHDSPHLCEPLAADGTVFVISVDRRRLLAIDEHHGIVRWTTTLPSDVHCVLGECNGTIVVSGDCLWGLEATTGELIWKCGFDSPDGAAVGKGLLVGEIAWWTTHDALLGTDVVTGELVARVAIREAWGITGGDLLLAENHLLILNANGLSALDIEWLPSH